MKSFKFICENTDLIVRIGWNKPNKKWLVSWVGVGEDRLELVGEDIKNEIIRELVEMGYYNIKYC